MADRPVTRRLTRLTASLGEIDAAVVAAAGEAVADALTRQLTADAGGDQALSGIAKGRYRLGIDLTPLSNPVGVRIRPKRRQAGMWAILESGRSGFTARARPRRKTRPPARWSGSAREYRATAWGQAMNVGGGWRAGPWTVGPTAGKHTWSKGRDKGRADALTAARAVLRGVMSGG